MNVLIESFKELGFLEMFIFQIKVDWIFFLRCWFIWVPALLLSIGLKIYSWYK